MPSRPSRYVKALVLAGGAALALAGPAIAIAPGIPETEPNETAATAAPIPTAGTCYGFLPFGSISPQGDVDYFSFPAAAGDRFWSLVDTGGTMIGGGSSRDSTLTLFAPDGTTQLEYDDDGAVGNGGDSTVEAAIGSQIAGTPLASSGIHPFRTAGFGNLQNINPYRQYAAVTSKPAVGEVEPNDTTETANAVPDCKTPIGGSIGHAADSDRFEVELRAGQTLFASADADPERNGSDTNIGLRLRRGASLLDVNATPGGISIAPQAESLGFDIVEDGTYVVEVTSGGGGATGSYRILVAENDVVPPETTIATPPAPIGNDPTPTIVFAQTDDVSSPAQITAECALGPVGTSLTPRACSGAGTDTPAAPLTDGAYRYSIRGIDASGSGEESFATADFEIDTVPPTIVKLKAKVKRDDAKLKFKVTDANGIADLKCKVDKKTKDCDAKGKRKFKNLDDGRHKATVTATDVAGNATTVKRKFRVR